LRLALFQSQNGLWKEAAVSISAARDLEPDDWRGTWYYGLNVLGGGNSREALLSFDSVYADMPGELAPKFAMALALESGGDFAQAARYFEIVSLTDPSFISATFGLARCQRDGNLLDEAVQSYSRVPTSSQFYTKAQIAKAKTWLRSSVRDRVADAAGAIEVLALEGQERHRIFAEVLHRALELVKQSPNANLSPQLKVFGKPMDERSIRRELEDNLRGLARLSRDRLERDYLVDLANSVRPRTWI
jgi:serine/threonine-protein kinase PknG